MAIQVTKTFSAVGVTADMHIKKGQQLHWRFDALASWDGTVVLRKTKDQHNYEVVETLTDTDNNGATLTAEEDANYSFQCTVFTAGTAAVTLSDFSTKTVAELGAGRPVANVTAEELGSDGVVHKTLLRITSLPIEVISVTTAAGVGGSKIYDFPEGQLNVLGTVSDLSLVIAAGKQADFTDATPAGDIGVGTLAPANDDALGTDATDDNFSTAVALTMAAFSSSSQLPSEAALIHDGISTAINMFINVLIDAGDIDDGVTTEILVSGTVLIHWVNLGDL